MPTSKQKQKDKKPKDRAIEIKVNGQKVEVTEKKLSYKQVVRLFYPDAEFGTNIAYTVNYKRGVNQKPKGVMVEGDVVTIKKGMVFNVSATDKS